MSYIKTKKIEFYPQSGGFSMYLSFYNYDNNWTGCLDLVSSGPDNLKIIIESGKVYDDEKNFICPVNIPYAGKVSDNNNIISGNFYESFFNLYKDGVPVYARTEKNYGVFSGINIYTDNEFWDATPPTLKISASDLPFLDFRTEGTGLFLTPTFPLILSGNSLNKFPIKIYSINLGVREAELSELIQYYYLTGTDFSTGNTLLINPGESRIFNVNKTNPDIPLNNQIPFFLNTSYGKFIRTVNYKDILLEKYPQSSEINVSLAMSVPYLDTPRQFDARIDLAVFNTTENTSGFYITVSGNQGNDQCDYTLCDRFYPHWRAIVDGKYAAWLNQSTDFAITSNFFGQPLRKENSSIFSILYTGGYTGGDFQPNIFIAKNILTPANNVFNNVTGFGLVLYNDSVETGANLNIKIYYGDHWSGNNAGYNNATGAVTPNTGKLLYDENTYIDLTTEPVYYPIQLTGNLLLSGSEKYSFVFAGWTDSGKIIWPKNSNSVDNISGDYYKSNLNYNYINTMISNSGSGIVINKTINSFSGINYNHAFEINPPTTFPKALFGYVPISPNTANQLFKIEIGKSIINDNFTGSASYIISGNEILHTGIVGITKNLFREFVGYAI